MKTVKPHFEVETADFRMTAPKLTTHDGVQYLSRFCEELIGGRWEGFVSMQMKANAGGK